MREPRFTLRQAADWLGIRWEGAPLPVQGVSSDSRTLQPGELFIALRGPNHDGHDHLARAAAAGAVAAIVSHPADTALPQLQVEDTRIALGELAAGWRQALALPLVAVTGSNGKTTVKEMVAAILGQRARVGATRGNLNNDIGVPLTLLSLERGDEFAVVEMGANHAGEIAYLTRLAAPDVAIITNAGPAHLEGFGSLVGVAEAKGEIFAGLSDNGVAVINADDPFAALWQSLAAPHRCITFGLQAGADVHGSWSAYTGGGVLTIHHQGNRVEVPLALAGEHNACNALAATAACLALGVSLPRIAKGLASVAAVAGRLEWLAGTNGATVINDSYNANPASFAAAIRVLATQTGRRWLVLGEMGELGPDSVALHTAVGAEAKQQGIDALYATGALSRHAVEAFGTGGYYFEQQGALCAALLERLDSDVTLLVKGSRSSQMERVVAAVTEPKGALDAALS